MIKAIIVEDEEKSARLLANLLSTYCADVVLLGSASTISEAIQLINLEEPDVLFLDIELQKETGFDLLKRFTTINFQLVFTTAFEQYALNAIKCSALDYLLKPIDVDELKAAVEKVQRQKLDKQVHLKLELLTQHIQNTNTQAIQIALATNEGLHILKVTEILYLESDRQYTTFFLTNGEKVMTSKNIGEYEDLLSTHNFFRIHHSYLINLAEVKKFVRDSGGMALMSNGVLLDISKRRKDAFLKQFIKQ